jgi:hypothetical protein
MTKLPRLLALAVILGLSAAGARAATAPPTPVPDPKPDLSSMTYLIGTWNCTSMVRGSKRPDTTVYSLDYDGRWIKGHDTAPPFDKFRTRAIVTDTWITYNPINKMWMSTSVDNFGGYGIGSSPGWKGNQITTTIVVSPDGTTGSDVLTKVSNTETKDVATTKDKSGKANPTVTTTCMKAH